MARPGSLADLMKRGIVKSAWGDGPDSDGLHGREPVYNNDLATAERDRLEALRRQEWNDIQRREQEASREAAFRRQEEEAQLRLQEELRRQQAAAELEAIPGFGEF